MYELWTVLGRDYIPSDAPPHHQIHLAGSRLLELPASRSGDEDRNIEGISYMMVGHGV